MNASAIAGGLVTLLGAASAFGSQYVSSSSYQVLESSTGSALVVQWTGLRSEPMTHGDDRRRLWNFQLRCFIRDTGQAESVLGRVWAATDVIINALESDPTIQGTATEVQGISARRDPETAMTVGGATWHAFEYNVEILEWT